MSKFKAQNKSSATGGSAFGGKIQMPKLKFCHLIFVLCTYFGFCALSFVIKVLI